MAVNRPTAKPTVDTKVKKTTTTNATSDKHTETQHKINKYGVTYYTLNDKDDKWYGGEENTQGCGLTPQQMDANLNYLHGDDIKDGRFETSDNSLTLDRWFAINDDLKKDAEKHKNSIGPVKISTKGLVNGSCDTETGEITLNVNGEKVIVDGTQEHSEMLKKEVNDIYKFFISSTVFVDLKCNKPVIERGVLNILYLTASLRVVNGENKEGLKFDEIIIKQNGVHVGSTSGPAESYTKKIIIPKDTRASVYTFTAEAKYKQFGETITFKKDLVIECYYPIYVGTRRIDNNTYLIDDDSKQEKYTNSTAKDTLFKITLPSYEEMGLSNTYNLVFYIPEDVYNNDKSYDFWFDGLCKINMVNSGFGDLPVKNINNGKYYIFESLSEYRVENDTDVYTYKIKVI